MDMIALSPFVHNPYRILGLNGGANQAAIDEAAHGLGEALLQRAPKATPWDIRWLGPLSREEANIDYALRRLEDPSLRLRERLMWFHEGESLLRGLSRTTIDSVVSKWANIDRPSARHDAALLSIIAAFYLDSEIRDEDRWLNAMSLWNDALATGSYWAGIVDIESKGGFATAATMQEITSLKNVAGLAVADIVVATAKDAAMRSDALLIKRALHLLRSAPLSDKVRAGKESELFGELEEAFYALCADLRHKCNDDIRQDGRSSEANKEVCREALDRLNTELLPKLDFILGLEGQNTPLSLRTRERAAFCVHDLAMDHLWAEEFSTVQRLLQKARELAPIDSIILGLLAESMAIVAEKIRQSEATDHVHAQVHGQMHDQIAWKPIPEKTLKKKMSPESKRVMVAASVGVAVAAYIIFGTGKPEKEAAPQSAQLATQDHRIAAVEKTPQEAQPARKNQQQEPVVAPPTRKDLPHLTRKETSPASAEKAPLTANGPQKTGEAAQRHVPRQQATTDAGVKKPLDQPAKQEQAKHADTVSKKSRAESFIDDTTVKTRDTKKRQQLTKTTRKAEKLETTVQTASSQKPPAQTADAELRRLRTSLDKLMSQLDMLRGKIDARKGAIDNYERQINSGETVDRNAYNKTLAEYNTLVRDYNEQLARGRKIAADLDKLGG